MNHTHSLVHDNTGNVIKSIDYVGTPPTFECDPKGRLTKTQTKWAAQSPSHTASVVTAKQNG